MHALKTADHTCPGKVSSVKCHLSTIVMICMHQFENMWHNSMHQYVNIVSKYMYIIAQMSCFLVFYQTQFSQSCGLFGSLARPTLTLIVSFHRIKDEYASTRIPGGTVDEKAPTEQGTAGLVVIEGKKGEKGDVELTTKAAASSVDPAADDISPVG